MTVNKADPSRHRGSLYSNRSHINNKLKPQPENFRKITCILSEIRRKQGKTTRMHYFEWSLPAEFLSWWLNTKRWLNIEKSIAGRNWDENKCPQAGSTLASVRSQGPSVSEMPTEEGNASSQRLNSGKEFGFESDVHGESLERCRQGHWSFIPWLLCG